MIRAWICPDHPNSKYLEGSYIPPGGCGFVMYTLCSKCWQVNPIAIYSIHVSDGCGGSVIDILCGKSYQLVEIEY